MARHSTCLYVEECWLKTQEGGWCTPNIGQLQDQQRGKKNKSGSDPSSVGGRQVGTAGNSWGPLTYRTHERMGAWTVPKTVTSLENWMTEVENCTSTS